MSLFIVPDSSATPLAAALALAASAAAPGHTTDLATVHEDGQFIGLSATCACGWEVVRPTTHDAQIESALHRVAPGDWKVDPNATPAGDVSAAVRGEVAA